MNTDSASSSPLPMFPLGTVVFPGAVLPLHVFESRYQLLVRDCLDGDGRFGVVLIERGNEVGGGDTRFDAGTICRIAESHEFDDGRWAVLAEGESLLRVDRWLDDDPYPRAVVTAVTEQDMPSRLDLSEIEQRLRRCLALAAEVGDSGSPATIELPADPGHALNAMCSTAPIAVIDSQTLLTMPSRTARLVRLGDLLDDAIETLEARLSGS